VTRVVRAGYQADSFPLSPEHRGEGAKNLSVHGGRSAYSNSVSTFTPLLVSTIGTGRSTPGG
jgi:hypothetical protein